jgi:catechol 2,3-dioxygenase-like lactoylglutathione lyase family enzyme
MRAQPLIAVRDVEKSRRWYCALLGCVGAHGGREYEQLRYDGDLILQLHAWETERHEHPHMGRADVAPSGNGVLLWFQTDDFEAAVLRARELGAEILEEPHENPNARHMEVWIRDLDGYVVVIAGKPGKNGTTATR